MPEWLKFLLRPLYFRVSHWRGNPGFDIRHYIIKDIIREYDGVRTFLLEATNPLSAEAGQYGHVIAPGGIRDNHTVRHMSFGHAPHEALAILSMDLASDTRFKRKFATAKPGDRVGIFKVRGEFTLSNFDTAKHRLFIAGGIGIVPIRSLVSAMEQDGVTGWSLVYAGKGYLYEDFWAPLGDRVQKVKRDTLFPALKTALQANDDVEVCICGSDGFVTAVTAFLTSEGIPADAVHTENFGA